MAARPDDVATYAQVAEKAGLARLVFERRGIALHTQSVLSQIFDQADALAETAKSGPPAGIGIAQLIATMHANRISDAIFGVAEEAFAQELLIRIAKKDMDLALRAASQGNDALWELELLAFLRRKGARLPATKYAIQRLTAIYGSQNYTDERGVSLPQAPDGYLDNVRNTICNAGGFFTFDSVADGEYYVQSNVTWNVGHRSQGGALMRRVTVAGGQVKEVTLAP